MNEHECTFIPHSVTDFMLQFKERYYLTHLVLWEVISETMKIGVARADVNVDQIYKSKGIRSRKRLLSEIVKMKQDAIILYDSFSIDPFVLRRVGLNPEKFGPLFPSYQEALRIVG